MFFDEMFLMFLLKVGTFPPYYFYLKAEMVSLGQNMSRAVELSFFSLIFPKEGFFFMLIWFKIIISDHQSTFTTLSFPQMVGVPIQHDDPLMTEVGVVEQC